MFNFGFLLYFFSNVSIFRFHGGRYDLFKHNCNNFSSYLTKFLGVENIPQHILDLPDKVRMVFEKSNEFLTAILHRGLRNDFFFSSVRHFRIYFFQFLFGLLFPFSIWTFISLLYLDFYFPFLFGLLFRDIS